MIKSKITTVVLIVIAFIGVGLMLYPSVSDYWNSVVQSKAILTYSDDIALIKPKDYNEILTFAHEYNQNLAKRQNPYTLNDSQLKQYEGLLNISNNGMMGYIEIPSIGCTIPVYHGTSEEVLQFAVGHLEWSSLPVGGVGTHSVLSGHRGLPSAKLFTDIDKLNTGDLFHIRILNETFTYEVDQILIVEPEDTYALLPEDNLDLCTLVTCTPYGINTHRLLVRGHRIENAQNNTNLHVISNAVRVDSGIVAVFIGIPIVLVFIVFLFVKPKKKERFNSIK